MKIKIKAKKSVKSKIKINPAPSLEKIVKVMGTNIFTPLYLVDGLFGRCGVKVIK